MHKTGQSKLVLRDNPGGWGEEGGGRGVQDGEHMHARGGFMTLVHLLKSKLPTVYYIAEAKSFGIVALIRVVELFAIYQRTPVVNGHNAANVGRSLAFAYL